MTQEEWDREEAAWRQAKQNAKSTRPVRSDMRDGNPSAHYWCALLDGRPAAHCTAFDTEEGWVEVYIVAEKRGNASMRATEQVRIYGAVEAIWCDDFHALCKTRPPFEVLAVRRGSE